jgi:hypothetical protein
VSSVAATGEANRPYIETALWWQAVMILQTKSKKNGLSALKDRDLNMSRILAFQGKPPNAKTFTKLKIPTQLN